MEVLHKNILRTFTEVLYLNTLFFLRYFDVTYFAPVSGDDILEYLKDKQAHPTIDFQPFLSSWAHFSYDFHTELLTQLNLNSSISQKENKKKLIYHRD